MISLMRLGKFLHFLTLVVVLAAFIGTGKVLLASPTAEIVPKAVPVLKKPQKNKRVPLNSEEQLPALQITPVAPVKKSGNFPVKQTPIDDGSFSDD